MYTAEYKHLRPEVQATLNAMEKDVTMCILDTHFLIFRITAYFLRTLIIVSQ